MLEQDGAMFASDIMNRSRLLPAQLDEALGELISRGIVTADGFSGLRKLIARRSQSSGSRRPRRSRLNRARANTQASGRWALWRQTGTNPAEGPGAEGTAQQGPEDPTAQWAWQLLRRWGLVFRDLLVREPCAAILVSTVTSLSETGGTR